MRYGCLVLIVLLLVCVVGCVLSDPSKGWAILKLLGMDPANCMTRKEPTDG